MKESIATSRPQVWGQMMTRWEAEAPNVIDHIVCDLEGRMQYWDGYLKAQSSGTTSMKDFAVSGFFNEGRCPTALAVIQTRKAMWNTWLRDEYCSREMHTKLSAAFTYHVPQASDDLRTKSEFNKAVQHAIIHANAFYKAYNKQELAALIGNFYYSIVRTAPSYDSRVILCAALVDMIVMETLQRMNKEEENGERPLKILCYKTIIDRLLRHLSAVVDMA